MAKVLDEFPAYSPGQTRQASMFDKYADGRVYEFESGVDFNGSAEAFRSKCCGYATSRKLKAKTHRTSSGNMVVQFTKRETNGEA